MSGGSPGGFLGGRPALRVLAVIGLQGAGKTTWIERMLRCWVRAGVRAAVIKHDGHAEPHAFTAWEKPGSDTVRYAAAGAAATVVAGGGRTLWMHRDDPDSNSPEALIDRVVSTAVRNGRRLDVVVVEGFKRSALPKLVILRRPSDVRWFQEEQAAGRLSFVWAAACTGDLVVDSLSSEGAAQLGAAGSAGAGTLAGLVPRVYDESDITELCDDVLSASELVWPQDRHVP